MGTMGKSNYSNNTMDNYYNDYKALIMSDYIADNDYRSKS